MAWSRSMTRPVSISAQTLALTNGLSEWPLWLAQSPERIFSAIRASWVSASGTRSSASARHISATPSWLDRPNSARKASSVPRSFFSARERLTMAWAVPTMAARAASSRVSDVNRALTAWASSPWVAARTAARAACAWVGVWSMARAWAMTAYS